MSVKRLAPSAVLAIGVTALIGSRHGRNDKI